MIIVLCTNKNEMGRPRRDTELLQAIAARLRDLRKERGLSQIDVFIDTDIHVGRVEGGRTNITVSTLSALCHRYGISPREFFDGVPFP